MSAHTFDTTGMDNCPFMPVFGAPALSIERGSGTEVWDTDGKRYLDFLSGIAVTSLGHANPVIADAICRQQLLHEPTSDGSGGQGERVAQRGHRPRRTVVLHELRGGVERVRAQAGP
jgi:4-aminobutyrate aminotransferase-like enzyme